MSSIRKEKLNPELNLSPEDLELFDAAWKIAREYHGEIFTFYLPGMVRYGKVRGRYPAISITGDRCELQCEHCRGKLLEPMIHIRNREELINIAQRFARQGAHGILLTGGSDSNGMLPWNDYWDAIKTIKEKTSLFLSAHTGFPDYESCILLKKAGLSQALVDVMGDDITAKKIYHLHGLNRLTDSLEAIRQSGIAFVPHIVAGLYYGKIKAEFDALEIIRRYKPAALVIVVLTPLKGTPMAEVSPPSPVEIGRLIAKARLLMPEIPISLGCERPRNREGWLMERLAIRAGATRMGVWSEEAIREAVSLGLKMRFQATCCSLEFTQEYSFSYDYAPYF
ncbi:MAG TPA: radical SAM protein [Desulfobacteraceae bacterium]|nr:radical SAM protein [Desulfobacteraceae bacterium]HPJ68121.1 radical SAM protein [Desulfobacteraceae bacterium]